MRPTFVSYDAKRHGHYKNLILAWVANDRNFRFNDHSIDTSINSMDGTYIRSVIKGAIRESDVFIVIVGDYVSMNIWVGWECKTAREMNKKIYVIKTESQYGIPSELYGYWNLKVLIGFNKENIQKTSLFL